MEQTLTVRTHGLWISVWAVIHAVILIAAIILLFTTGWELSVIIGSLVLLTILAIHMVFILFLSVNLTITPTHITLSTHPIPHKKKLLISDIESYNIQTNQQFELTRGFFYRRGRNGISFNVGAPWVEFTMGDGSTLLASVATDQIVILEGILAQHDIECTLDPTFPPDDSSTTK
ncbi:MAG: hypothetical protein Q4P66_08015 [Actinomycetaceae bacterium]|nr:hypothetical protein [Actinomycetaceae bacterium]